MYAKNIKFKDIDGEEREYLAYFHYNESEVIKLFYSVDGGLDEFLKNLVKKNTEKTGNAPSADDRAIINMFEKIVLNAFGVREKDPITGLERFRKKDDKDVPIWKGFRDSEAYSALFMEFLTEDKNAANEFVTKVFPPEMMKKAKAKADELKAREKAESDGPAAEA